MKDRQLTPSLVHLVVEAQGDSDLGQALGPSCFHGVEGPQPLQSQRRHGVRGTRCRYSLAPMADYTPSRGEGVEGSLRNTNLLAG